MTPEAQQALRMLGVPVMPHGARNLTVELAHQVEKIYCMDQAHRTRSLIWFRRWPRKRSALIQTATLTIPSATVMALMSIALSASTVWCGYDSMRLVFPGAVKI